MKGKAVGVILKLHEKKNITQNNTKKYINK